MACCFHPVWGAWWAETRERGGKNTTREGKLNNAKEVKTGGLNKKRLPWDGEKEAKTEATVDEVAEELPHQRSQPFRYLWGTFPWGLAGCHRSGARGRLGTRPCWERRAAWRSTFYVSFWPLAPCSVGAQATGAYPHLAKESPKGMRFITHSRHAAGVSYKSIRLLAGPSAGTQVSLMNC